MKHNKNPASVEHPEIQYLFDSLEKKLCANHPGTQDHQLESAFEIALRAHENQFRESGEPYILHPLEVAHICADLGMDEDSLIAALLHDTVEDTPIRLKRIRQLFGGEIARMVDALTKIKRIDFFARFSGRTMSDEQARNLQKLFVAMAQDFRVLVVKLADRLHNLRSVEVLSRDRAERMARETLDFYVPLARRLGLQSVANEMEDICFRQLNPEEHEWIVRMLRTHFDAKRSAYERMIGNITQALANENIALVRCFGRRKSPYSAWLKMKTQNLVPEQIFDLIAIRVVIDGDELDCYRALGIIHGLYRPMFNRFRDFIAAPKSNGYRSLHTSVDGEGGQITEVQIRNRWMDDVAEHGIAAHWKYKHQLSQLQLRETFSWFKFMEDLSEDHLDSRDFVEKTRESLAQKEVLVLSPQGEVVSLPEGATALDFAYYIHTELGHAASQARVNGADVPLDYELHNGDIVEIIKNPEGQSHPRPEWLNLVHSPKSIVKIKRWFRRRPRKERIQEGKLLLRTQIEKEGLRPLRLMDDRRLLELVKALRIRKIDDLFEEIAAGRLMARDVVKQLKSMYLQRAAQKELIPSETQTASEISASRPVFRHAVGLASELGIGTDENRPLRRKVELAPCCTAVPGDSIIGVDNRREHRVEIHHRECPRAAGSTQGDLVPVTWLSESVGIYYPALLHILGLNRVGLLYSVLGKLSQLGVNLAGGSHSHKPTPDGGEETVHLRLVVEVQNSKQLAQVIQAVSGVEDVLGVFRSYQVEVRGES